MRSPSASPAKAACGSPSRRAARICWSTRSGGGGRLGRTAATLLASSLGGFADLPLLLDARLLVEAPALELLKDAFLRHLLLEDLHRLLEAFTDLDFDRAVIHASVTSFRTLI